MWLSEDVSQSELVDQMKRSSSDSGSDRLRQASTATRQLGFPTSTEVRTIEFRQTLRGYHIDDVDALLMRVATEMEAGRSPRGLVHKATFRQTLRGYHTDDVDRFLARLARHPGGLARDQRPSTGLRVAVVTCMDGRVDPTSLLGLESGSAHIIRNAGGIVTDDVIRSLTISQRVLGTEEVTLIQHTDCGMLRITDEAFSSTIQKETGVTPSWTPGAFSDLYSSVLQGVGRIRSSPFIPKREEVNGFVYDLDSGRLDEVSDRGARGSQFHGRGRASNASQWGGWW